MVDTTANESRASLAVSGRTETAPPTTFRLLEALRATGIGLVVPCLFVLIWWLTVVAGVFPESVLPSPVTVVKSLWIWAFGNKEELFRRALDRYAEKGPGAVHRKALAEPTARDVVERLLKGVAEFLTDPKNPPGCLSVQGALSCGEAAESIKSELCRRRAAGECALRERFERAKAEGDLAVDADTAALARFIVTVTQGMSVQVAGGASREDLSMVADMALKAWPG